MKKNNAKQIGQFFIDNFEKLPEFDIRIDKNTWIKKEISKGPFVFEKELHEGDIHTICFIKNGEWNEFSMLIKKEPLI